MRRTRRAVLSGVLGVSLAGCADRTERMPSPTAVGPSTAAVDALAFDAEVVRQASADTPARVRATLENTGTTAAEVSYGPALLFTDNADNGLSWPRALVLDPETYVGPSAEPYQDEEGCWRFPEDGAQAVQSSLETRELAAGESVSEAYDVYTRETGPCLPAGTYLFEDKGSLGSRALVLGLELAVGEDGTITATGRAPTVAD